MDKEILLEAIHIVKRFGGVQALDDGNLVCTKGKITGLLGHNGSGKSTISKIVNGTYWADSGKIVYRGKEVHYKHPIESRRDGISLVFQNLSLIPDLAVWQNIVLGLEKSKGLVLDDRHAKELAASVVNKLQPGLDLNKKVSELRPGEMQIVEVAKGMASDPELLILDEPTSALDKNEVNRLFVCMRDLAAKGVAIVFTSHRIDEVLEICDEVTIFKAGRNVCSLDFSVDEKDENEIIRHIAGTEEKINARDRESSATDEICLSVRNVDYAKNLFDITFDLHKGEILGIGGLAGQGQRELMMLLSGFLQAKAGDIELDGMKLQMRNPRQAIERGITLVPGDRQLEGLFLSKSVFFNLIFPDAMMDRSILIPKKKYEKECKKIVDRLGIVIGDLSTEVNNLSGGNQQKIVVGKWLPFDTKIVLLDDPAKGVDVGAKADLYTTYVEQARDSNTAVILYASDYNELIDYCDCVLIMYEGRIVKELRGDQITDNNIVEASIGISKNASD